MLLNCDFMKRLNALWKEKNKILDFIQNTVRHYSTPESNHLKDSEVSKPALAKTAIGASNFKKLAWESTVFVDKSLLIKDFIENEGETLLMTFPRRWGKSINLDMIKTFLSNEADAEGKIGKIKIGENLKFFKGGDVVDNLNTTKTLKPLKISKHQDIVTKYQGKFPVIAIDFKDTKGSSYTEVETSIKQQIVNLYANNKYLEKYLNESEKTLTTAHKKQLENYFSDNLDKQALKMGLKFLSKLLHLHFNQNSFILIDEYDAAINDSYIKLGCEESQKIVELFRGINEATFKGNDYLQKGLITGVFRIAKANLFSGLNNLSEYNILNKEFAQYYGFTEEEVQNLLYQYDVPNDLSQDIREWYDGYNSKGTKIYNPWSMVHCLKNFRVHHNKSINDVSMLKSEILKNYWEESGNIDFIKDLFKNPLIKNKIDRLIEDKGSLQFNLIEQISSNDFKILKEVINLSSNCKIDETVADLLFSYLFSAGYLTISEKGGFKLPNYEIKTEFQKKLLEYYKQQYNIPTELFTNVTNELQKILDSKNKSSTDKAKKSFQESFASLLAKFPKFEKIKDRNFKVDETGQTFHGNEDLIHCVMSYITLQLKSISKFGTEIHLGKGVADIMFIDKLNQKGIVIELKYNKNATVAVEQVKTQEYTNSLIKEMDVIVIGVNVSQDKTVDIKYKEISKGDNLSGSGTNNEENNSYNLPYNEWFNKYYSEGIEKILQLRIKDLGHELREKIKMLPAKYQLSSENADIDKIIEEIAKLHTKECDIILVPYNIENKHWVSLIFKNNNKSFEVIYSDPENKPINHILLAELERGIIEHLGKNLQFRQQVIEQQKYNNCGAEVIENFILYLTGKRVSQEKAIELHSKLVENELLNVDSSGVHFLFENQSNNNSSDFGYLEQRKSYDQLLHNFDYDNHQSALLGQDHNETI